jgi:ankyrin repeat protein/transcriptional regulator with XRE-family HTH domain
MNFENTAKEILKIRISNNLTQDEFARKLDVSRPTVSNWELAKCIPTTEQIMKINDVFHVSANEILQIKKSTIFVLDTCVILNRPRIINQLLGNENISQIIIPDTVISELNYQKDHGQKQQAWLAMVTIEKFRKEYPHKLSIVHEENANGINDQKIIFAATQVAKRNIHSIVYMLTNDVFFSLAEIKLHNLEVLNLQDFEEKFPINANGFNREASFRFFAEVKAGNIKAAKIALSKGANPNFIHPESGYTPLIQAVRNRDKSMTEFIANHPKTNCDLCDEAKYRLPAISHAVQLGEIALVKTLVEAGADIDCQSQGKNRGNTALMISAWHGKQDFVQYFYQNGACPNQQDSNGFTALIKACIKKQVSCAKFLYPLTDPKIRSFEGLTALDYAIKSNNTELLNFFKEA